MTMQNSGSPTSSAKSTASPLPAFPAVERLLDGQAKLYRDLEALSTRQGELIDSERTDELLTLLGEREQVLTRIQTLNDAISPVRARWQEFLTGLDAIQRSKVGTLVDQITALIEGIAERDRQDRQRMESARDRVADELAGLDRTRRAAGAYGAKLTSPGPLFQDREA